jgi:hypothetical protein
MPVQLKCAKPIVQSRQDDQLWLPRLIEQIRRRFELHSLDECGIQPRYDLHPSFPLFDNRLANLVR